MIRALKFLAATALSVVSSTDYPEPPQILSNPVTEWTGSYGSSRVGKISSKFTNTNGEEGLFPFFLFFLFSFFSFLLFLFFSFVLFLSFFSNSILTVVLLFNR